MRLHTVVSAVNMNPHYMAFVPNFITSWKYLFPNVDVRVVVIADELPKMFEPFVEHLVLHPCPKGLSDVTVAQCIRLLYPREIDTSEGVLITDIDMFPLQREYYIRGIDDVQKNTLVIYRNGLPDELYMCYLCAAPAVWTSLIGSEDTDTLLTKWCANTAWNTDQTELTKAFYNWKGPTKIWADRELRFNRLCRSFKEHKLGSEYRSLIDSPVQCRVRIQEGLLTDYHALPEKDHVQFNRYIVDSLNVQLNIHDFVPTSTLLSYAPLLYLGMLETKKAIIECGMGEFSSKLLHDTNKPVISYETSQEWFDKFPTIYPKKRIHADSWIPVLLDAASKTSIFFIDQAPGEIREKCIESLVLHNFDGIIVAHDTEPSADHGYKMRQHFPRFKYVCEVQTDGAWATAMSNTVDVTKWIGRVFGEYRISSYVAPIIHSVPVYTPLLQSTPAQGAVHNRQYVKHNGLHSLSWLKTIKR